MIKLRPYQEEAIETIKNTFQERPRQYVEMPTGSGKTVTFLSYAKQYHKTVLIIVPTKQLLHQVYETALLFYPKENISRKGDIYNESIKQVHIIIINSIRGSYLEFLSKNTFDLIVVDEAHHIQAKSYLRFLQNFNESQLVLGVTATPQRRDRKFIEESLGDKSFFISVESLITSGFLSDLEGYRVKTNIDISGIDSHNGDFNVSDLYKKLGTDERNQIVVELCKKEMKDRKCLIFAINVKHSMQLKDLLKSSGINVEHIDGKTDFVHRTKILESFRNGDISFLTNCQLLTEGFDEPSIDGIILARPTTSRALFLQMIGRGLRIFPNKKNCKIIDIVDNHKATCSFSSLLTDFSLKEMDKFRSFSDLKKNVTEQLFKIEELRLERTNFFNLGIDLEPTNSQIEYLQNNYIEYHPDITFDESSFLIWINELKRSLKWR